MSISVIFGFGRRPNFFIAIFFPLAVLNELEGLARGGRERDMSHMSLPEQAHAATVSENARQALSYLRAPLRSLPTIRCVTTNGKFINSFTTYTVEDDIDRVSICFFSVSFVFVLVPIFMFLFLRCRMLRTTTGY